MSDRLLALQTIYDIRAPTYDTQVGFHPSQAADYVKWMALKSGLNVLDLACGTGAVAIPASRAVGPSGKVIGIDISEASLNIARAKAENENLNVKLLQHDVSSLQGLEEEGVQEGTFDIITCASAFVLLEDPNAAVREWTKYLKKGGRMIFDVPTNDTMIQGVVLDRVAPELGIEVKYGRVRLDSEEKVRALLEDAGLDAAESFASENYAGPQVFRSEEAGNIFDAMVAPEKWQSFWYKDLTKPEVIGNARKLFCREFEKLADEEGNVRSYLKFHMAVGKKV